MEQLVKFALLTALSAAAHAIAFAEGKVKNAEVVVILATLETVLNDALAALTAADVAVPPAA